MTEPSIGNPGGRLFLQVTGKEKNNKIERVPNTVKKLRTFCTDQSFSCNTSDTTKCLSSSLSDTFYSTAQLPTFCLQPP